MHFARRQHNATLLPDGTVLVTGGTQGNGAKYQGEQNGFNDLRIGSPIRAAEIWNPDTGHWTQCAEASVDRCYHSTAFLLPDATVVSAGGGEYSPANNGAPNLPEDTHRDAQIFSPPYLFHGVRPVITSAPNDVTYSEAFTIGTANSGQVGAVNWIRLSSVTHSNNMNQRINFSGVCCGRRAFHYSDGASERQCLSAGALHVIRARQKRRSVGREDSTNSLTNAVL